MRHPYELFLRHLLISRADVQGALRRISLPEVVPKWIEKERARLIEGAPPVVRDYLAGHQPAPVGDPEFRAWMESQGTWLLWKAARQAPDCDRDVESASTVFLAAHVRTVVGMMVIGQLPEEKIVSIAKGRFPSGYVFTRAVLRWFKRFFWNDPDTTESFWRTQLARFNSNQAYYLRTALYKGVTASGMRRILGLPGLPEDDLELLRITAITHLSSSNTAEHLEWSRVLLQISGKDTSKPPGSPFDQSLISVRMEEYRHPTVAELEAQELARMAAGSSTPKPT